MPLRFFIDAPQLDPEAERDLMGLQTLCGIGKEALVDKLVVDYSLGYYDHTGIRDDHFYEELVDAQIGDLDHVPNIEELAGIALYYRSLMHHELWVALRTIHETVIQRGHQPLKQWSTDTHGRLDLCITVPIATDVPWIPEPAACLPSRASSPTAHHRVRGNQPLLIGPVLYLPRG